MKVLKFGGTSLGSPERMKHVADLVIADDREKWVVLSAVSGTTNSLYEIVRSIKAKDQHEGLRILDDLKKKYQDYIHDLLGDSEYQAKGLESFENSYKIIESALQKDYSIQMEREVVAQGELISTQLFELHLRERGIISRLVSALDFMRLNKNGEPDMTLIAKLIKPVKKEMSEIKVVITQGFISLNHLGEIDNLKRGGSDFSASIIGACLNSDEVQIWTDIDGMHNNDPRIVKNTRPISKLTFDEAAELAYFGAKVLHPATILPAKQFKIPVRIKNTLKPEAEGTEISSAEPGEKGGVKAVAAKDGITAIKIRSSRMLMAYGFLRKIFEIFERYKTPIDMITTSEVAVSLTIDNSEHLLDIISSLEPLGEVEVDYDMSIICIVGNGIAEDQVMVTKIFNSLEQTRIRMISYGGSRNNISVLVKTSLRNQALEGLNMGLFGL